LQLQMVTLALPEWMRHRKCRSPAPEYRHSFRPVCRICNRDLQWTTRRRLSWHRCRWKSLRSATRMSWHRQCQTSAILDSGKVEVQISLI